MDVGEGKLVSLFIVEVKTILVDELRNRDLPQGGSQVLQDVLVDPLLNMEKIGKN